MKHALSILVVLSWILNFSDCSIISHLNRLRPDRMTEDDKEDDDSTWSFFKNQHGRFYSAKDEHIRKQMFLNHTAKVREHFKRYEKGETPFFIGLNHFSDMSDSERNDHLGNVPNIPKYNRVKRGISSQSYRINSGRPIFYMYSADKIALPDSVDYRTSGWTEPVRYQGRCGSCWAFAVSSAMSYYVYAKEKLNYIFSPQNLIDCSFSYGNNGCGGGFPLYAYEYIKVNNITLEAKFPYRGSTGACNKNSLKKLPLFGINSFVFINSDQNSLKQAVAKIGAVVVGISAGNLFDYAGGIWDGTNAKTRAACSLNINHAVTVIGYGSASNKTYWIIKNSWGVGWGEGGYFRMLMNGSNLCGIYSFASTII